MPPIMRMANAVEYHLSGSNQDSGFAYSLGNHFVLFPTLYLSSRAPNSTQNCTFRGQHGMMHQLGPGRLFLLSSAQAALRAPDFYECVKCLVDTLNLIYDHNNNGATSLREREATTRENKIWSIKHGQGKLSTGGGQRQQGDARQRIHHTDRNSKPHGKSLACLYMIKAGGWSIIWEQTQGRQVEGGDGQRGEGKCGSQHLDPQGQGRQKTWIELSYGKGCQRRW